MQNAKCKMQNAKCRMQNAELKVDTKTGCRWRHPLPIGAILSHHCRGRLPLTTRFLFSGGSKVSPFCFYIAQDFIKTQNQHLHNNTTKFSVHSSAHFFVFYIFGELQSLFFMIYLALWICDHTQSGKTYHLHFTYKTAKKQKT